MDELYGGDDQEADTEKPQWDDDIDIGDIVPRENMIRTGKKKKKRKRDDIAVEEGIDIDKMDADVVEDDEDWDGTEEMRKKKLDEYMDEVYGLDFNDMVRFPEVRRVFSPPAHSEPRGE